MNWTRVAPTKPVNDVDGEWLTPLGTKIILKAHIFAVPLYLREDPGMFDEEGYLQCPGLIPKNNLRQMNHIMWTAGHAHEVLFMDELADYDYLMK